ncbi:MAG TPA: GNAT family N-acetyltransferase [Planctomycetes bacterium]|nr:GNAT family N-acetyltransferase [Planctomycetota bacterium]
MTFRSLSRRALSSLRSPGRAAGRRGPSFPGPVLLEGGYRVRFALVEEDLERVQRLRFEVFNRELGEGLDSSWDTGRDEDEFDHSCDHLMLEDGESGALVGTYRMQTREMAARGSGFYCDAEVDLSALPAEVLDNGIELGRACILAGHRNGMALFALWRGLALYSSAMNRRLLFGCCSLTSQDPREGFALERRLEAMGRVSKRWRIATREGYHCDPELAKGKLPDVEMPRLFGTYLRYGAEVCSAPALDTAFRTIDFLILLDLDRIQRRVRSMFFSDLEPALEEAGVLGRGLAR